jgi:hypothetical protein
MTQYIEGVTESGYRFCIEMSPDWIDNAIREMASHLVGDKVKTARITYKENLPGEQEA